MTLSTVASPRLHRSVLPLVLAALLSACTQAPPTSGPRAQATVKLMDWAGWHPEDESNFDCPKDQVMTGRAHRGAEDKDTRYRCGVVTQYDDLEVGELVESSPIDESAGIRFVCPENKVMTGRQHLGDENGTTWYTCGKVFDYWGKPLQPAPDAKWLRIEDEEVHHSVECGEHKVMLGRWHDGDETKPTEYLCGKLY